jgi:hypothetical protein
MKQKPEPYKDVSEGDTRSHPYVPEAVTSHRERGSSRPFTLTKIEENKKQEARKNPGISTRVTSRSTAR